MFKLPTKRIIWLKVVTIVMIVFAMITMLIAGFFTVYIRVPVNGLSMAPALNSTLQQTGKRDIVYINRFAKATRGDIVVIDVSDNSYFDSDYIIKRLIAIEGDTVNIVSNSIDMRYDLIVNGEVVDSREYSQGFNTWDSFNEYLKTVDVTQKNDNGLIIGKNQVFALGDNWLVSKDSSLTGAFSQKDIVGKVDFIIQPSQNEFLWVLKGMF